MSSSDELRELVRVLRDIKRRLLSIDLILGSAIYLSFGLVGAGALIFFTLALALPQPIQLAADIAYWVAALSIAYVKVIRPLIRRKSMLEAAAPGESTSRTSAWVIAASVIATAGLSALAGFVLSIATGGFKAYYPPISLLISLAVLNAVINRGRPRIAAAVASSLAAGAASVPLAYSLVPNSSFIWGYTIVIISMVYSGVGLYLILKAAHLITSERGSPST